MAEKIQTITQDDLIRQEAESDEFSIEVDDGAIVKVERRTAFSDMIIMQNLYDILNVHIRANKLGFVYMDGARYILDGSPEAIRRAYNPALSFVSFGRIGNETKWVGDFVNAPDLAVEIIREGQKTVYVLKRIIAYFDAGVDDVWIIYPKYNRLDQYCRMYDAPRMYGENDNISTPLFPDLQISMAELFKKEA
jgi:Uma2 family endonuclease